mmetsp:Transcript_17398/g.37424  ORF Transcript_17398/g.37424 Transcript_17398/m.37424 type:complete len:266 (-) Transcript_17398:344-1141(-)
MGRPRFATFIARCFCSLERIRSLRVGECVFLYSHGMGVYGRTSSAPSFATVDASINVTPAATPATASPCATAAAAAASRRRRRHRACVCAAVTRNSRARARFRLALCAQLCVHVLERALFFGEECLPRRRQAHDEWLCGGGDSGKRRSRSFLIVLLCGFLSSCCSGSGSFWCQCGIPPWPLRTRRRVLWLGGARNFDRDRATGAGLCDLHTVVTLRSRPHRRQSRRSLSQRIRIAAGIANVREMRVAVLAALIIRQTSPDVTQHC